MNIENKAYESQKLLIDTIDIVVSKRIEEMNTTNSMIGVILEDPKGYECKVRIQDKEFECSIPEHLHSWIQKDDIVIIQDLYNDGMKKVITGKTGQLQKSPSLVFYDPDKDRLISGVDGIFNNDKKVTYGTVKGV